MYDVRQGWICFYVPPLSYVLYRSKKEDMLVFSLLSYVDPLLLLLLYLITI